MTQDEASERLMIAKRTLSGYEKGRRVPDDIACRMAEIYNKSTLIIWHIKEHTPLGKWIPETRELVDIQQLDGLKVITILAKDEMQNAENAVRRITETEETKDLLIYKKYIKSALSKLISLTLFLEKKEDSTVYECN